MHKKQRFVRINKACINFWKPSVKKMWSKTSAYCLEKYSQPISALLNSPYSDQGFWDYRHHKVSLESCREALDQQKQKIQKAVQERNLSEILLVILTVFQPCIISLCRAVRLIRARLTSSNFKTAVGFWPVCCPLLSASFWKMQQLGIRVNLTIPWYKSAKSA